MSKIGLKGSLMMRNAANRFLWMTLTCVTVGFFAWPCDADWRQFRGNDSSSVAQDADLPVEWSDGAVPKNIAWKIDLPGRGLASPIVLRDRVVVTCSSGFQQDRLHVFCFDVALTEKSRGNCDWKAPSRLLPWPRRTVCTSLAKSASAKWSRLAKWENCYRRTNSSSVNVSQRI